MRFIAALGACTILLTSCGASAPSAGNPAPLLSYFTSRESYEEYERVAQAGEHPSITEQVVGAVVPHHLYVGPEFARFYDALAGQKPSVVVIIGPNHFEAGRADIQTTALPYETPYGTLPADARLVQRLTSRGLAFVEDASFIREHSISAEVAFVRKAFPDTKLVPLILRVRLSRQRAEQLGKALAEMLPPDALVLASVDFSHYLPELAADFHDQTSRAALLNGDLDALQTLEVDSPPSLTAFTAYLRARGALKPLLEKHTNSASYGGHPELEETTSHFFLAFGKGQAAPHPLASVFMVGDTIADRGVSDRMTQLGSPEAVLDGVAHQEDRFFYGSSVNMLNLEGPITQGPPAHLGAPKVSFGFELDRILPVLKRMHITVASLANNHIDDAGVRGRDDSESALKQAKIVPLGVSDPCTVRPGIGMRIAVCAYFDGGGFLDVAETAQSIAEAAGMADRVVVSVHWGREYGVEPTARQRELAHAFIDAGADAVLGHGPHVIQPLEVYGGAPVFYSLGNFLFDDADPLRSSGLGAGLAFGADTTFAYVFPLRTVRSDPVLLPYAERETFLKRFTQGNESYATALPGKFAIPRTQRQR
jgi:AmmeMemoRadiSam system protein B